MVLSVMTSSSLIRLFVVPSCPEAGGWISRNFHFAIPVASKYTSSYFNVSVFLFAGFPVLFQAQDSGGGAFFASVPRDLYLVGLRFLSRRCAPPTG
jgi:hypothetical protein